MKRERLWKVGLKTQAGKTTARIFRVSTTGALSIDVPDYQGSRTVQLKLTKLQRSIRWKSFATLRGSSFA